MPNNNGRIKRFIHLIAPNAIWDIIKWLGGSSVMASIGHLFWLEFHRTPVDWYWLATLFLGGLILIFVGAWRQSMQMLDTSSNSQDIAGNQWKTKWHWKEKYLAENSEKARLQQVHDEEVRRLEVSRAAELSSCSQIRKRCEEERRRALDKVSDLEAQLSLFTPLQLDAFKLANEIQAFYAELGQAPDYPKEIEDGTSEGIVTAFADYNGKLRPYRKRLEHGFELRFAERTRKLVHEFAEKGIQNSSIRVTEVEFPFLGIEGESALPSNIRKLAIS